MSELLLLADGRTRIADTPGFRRLALRGIEADSLVAYFPELARLVPACAYGLSCTHSHETGCAIRAALEAGEIHPDRYESYLRIRGELESSIGYEKPKGRSRPSPRPGRVTEDDE